MARPSAESVEHVPCTGDLQRCLCGNVTSELTFRAARRWKTTTQQNINTCNENVTFPGGGASWQSCEMHPEKMTESNHRTASDPAKWRTFCPEWKMQPLA
ncbi:unnamed protein product [Lepidochelys kempii]